MGVVSDAFPLLRKVDGVIVVGRVGVSTRDCAENLPEQLRRLEAPVLGMVINAIKLRKRGRYGYGYYGGYGYGPGAEQPGGAGGRGRGRRGLGLGQAGVAARRGARRSQQPFSVRRRRNTG
jgi:hypothetical protein